MTGYLYKSAVVGRHSESQLDTVAQNVLAAERSQALNGLHQAAPEAVLEKGAAFGPAGDHHPRLRQLATKRFKEPAIQPGAQLARRMVKGIQQEQHPTQSGQVAAQRPAHFGPLLNGVSQGEREAAQVKVDGVTAGRLNIGAIKAAAPAHVHPAGVASAGLKVDVGRLNANSGLTGANGRGAIVAQVTADLARHATKIAQAAAPGVKI